ncbi:MAG: penicillin-binding transpeptidase domain-containing protein, partial [Eubacteriales bacterium]|nr:penicillin-binding transpeptidase domain-containing protein [Eubacteriales bacterium]
VRVVDMAKGYSTLANNGVYDERTCILRIDHEQQGELTKDMKPFARQVYQEDSAFMLTDILKGTLTESYGTGRGLALEGGMPAAGKTGTTNSSKDTWFCGYTRYYTAAVWVGYDTPRAMPGIYGSTYAGRIWKQTMDLLHQGKEPLDWEQPPTVELQSTSGITDYVSVTARLRAQQSLHDKEQRKLEEELSVSIAAYEDKTIQTVEDTYWVKQQYTSIMGKINQLDEGEVRGGFLARMAEKHGEFEKTIQEMQDTIALYEAQQARKKADSQKRAEEEAAKRRADLEVQTRKNEFLTALMDVEALEYQSAAAQQLIQTAISKLSLVSDYAEAASYSQRLQAAISRVSTLPTEEEWQMEQAKKAEEEAASQAAEQAQIQNEQAQLQAYFNQEQRKWSTYGPHASGPSGNSGGTPIYNGPGTTEQTPEEAGPGAARESSAAETEGE